MSHERPIQPMPQKPYEVFGLTDKEALWWRVKDEHLKEIIFDNRTTIHRMSEASNNFGEFMFVTTSRNTPQERIGITFFGLGFLEHRERWITDEWYWYQTTIHSNMVGERITKEEAEELLKQRLDSISPYLNEDTQTQLGKVFEILADLTDEDGALAEMEDLDESLDNWLAELDLQTPSEEPPPTGEYLLDPETREKLPKLYENEEQGLEAKALVKFFTPDANWTWYASEFDGEDVFFGVVSGFEVELGYFSLKELQEVHGPLGLQIERDLHYEPKSLKDLMEMHRLSR
jgi:hypothetical protein